jgi:hypothetical protein
MLGKYYVVVDGGSFSNECKGADSGFGRDMGIGVNVSSFMDADRR